MIDNIITVYFARDEYGDIVWDTFSKTIENLDTWFFITGECEGWTKCSATLIHTPPRKDGIDVHDEYKSLTDAVKKLEDQIEDLLGVDDAFRCEGCQEPIFDGDKNVTTVDGILCVICAPRFSYILNNPEYFLNGNNEPMCAEEAKAFCDQHIAAGGSLSDTTAT